MFQVPGAFGVTVDENDDDKGSERFTWNGWDRSSLATRRCLHRQPHYIQPKPAQSHRAPFSPRSGAVLSFVTFRYSKRKWGCCLERKLQDETTRTKGELCRSTNHVPKFSFPTKQAGREVCRAQIEQDFVMFFSYNLLEIKSGHSIVRKDICISS